MGSNAGAGNLDFLRNSPQVQMFVIKMSFLWYKLGHHFPFCAVPSFESYGAGKSPNPAGLLLFLAVFFLIHSSFFCVLLFVFVCCFFPFCTWPDHITCLLQPMLQELGKQNPHLVRLIQDHQADFLRLINEPAEGAEG